MRKDKKAAKSKKEGKKAKAIKNEKNDFQNTDIDVSQANESGQIEANYIDDKKDVTEDTSNKNAKKEKRIKKNKKISQDVDNIDPQKDKQDQITKNDTDSKKSVSEDISKKEKKKAKKEKKLKEKTEKDDLIQEDAEENDMLSDIEQNKKSSGMSLFVFLLDKLSEWIYGLFAYGFFGHILSSYSSGLSSYDNGHFVAYFKGTGKSRMFFRKIRMFLSRHFENSFIIKQLSKITHRLAFTTLKTYGSFFLAFGIYTMIVYLIKKFIPVTGQANVDYMFIGIIVCLASFPLYFSKKPLAIAVKNSVILGALFVDAFGYREEQFTEGNQGKWSNTGVAILIGLLAGILTFLVSPLIIIFAIICFIILILVVISPEIGVLLCIFGLPFCSLLPNPTLVLSVAVTLTIFSYVIKLIRGKRIFNLDLLDSLILIFAIIVFFSGAITIGGKSSYNSAVISCVLIFGYFLVVNLMRTPIWIKRCVLALVASGTIVSIIGVAEYLLGSAVNDWLDLKYFSSIYGRTTSLFDNPNYLAAYLALVFPFAVYLTFFSKTKKERLLCFLCDIIIGMCIIFTWSRGAWLAMLICLTVQCIIYSRKTMRLIWLSVISIPFLSFILPQNIIDRFSSIGNFADSSIMYRVYTWKGSMGIVKDYFWGGIGYGTETFREIYPMYAYAGIEAAAHSHSLFLQILIGMGIGGLICFALIIWFYSQKSFGYLKASSDKSSFMITVASLTSVIAFMIMGIFDYVWYNYRIFFMFWTIMAIGVACIKTGTSIVQKAQNFNMADEYSASIDI